MCTRLLEAWEIWSSLPGSGEDGFKLRRPKFTVQVSWACSCIPNGKAFATSQRSDLNPQGGVSWTVRVCSAGTIPWYKSLQQHYLWGGCCLQQLMARSSVLVKGGIFLLRCTSVFRTQKHTWIRNHGTCGTLKESGKRREENTLKRRLTHTKPEIQCVCIQLAEKDSAMTALIPASTWRGKTDPHLHSCKSVIILF